MERTLRQKFRHWEKKILWGCEWPSLQVERNKNKGFCSFLKMRPLIFVIKNNMKYFWDENNIAPWPRKTKLSKKYISDKVETMLAVFFWELKKCGQTRVLIYKLWSHHTCIFSITPFFDQCYTDAPDSKTLQKLVIIPLKQN